MKLDIIYEDNHQLVLNKPAGLLTQPSGTAQNSLEFEAKNWIKHHFHKPGNVFLEAVHRLDKPVSGIVLFARTSKALSRLQASMRAKESQKLYVAVAEGEFAKPEETLTHYLIHDDFQARIAPDDPSAKKVVLHYRVLKQSEGQALLEIRLETGRYHQIRAQLSEIGHPIVGDFKYGSSIPYAEEAIALHHYRLQIPHPITALMQTFEAPWPSAMANFSHA